MSKKVIIDCTIDEFNDILKDYDHYVKIDLKQSGTSAIFTVAKKHVFYTSLTGKKDDIIHVPSIANKLRKSIDSKWMLCDSPLKDLYGYKIVSVENAPHKTRIEWDLKDPGNYSWIDEDYIGEVLTCWSYDINSAYAKAMLNKMPDTTVPARSGYLGKDEMGFYLSGGATTIEGEWAPYIFPLVDSPYKDYVDYFYDLKKQAATKEERRKYKNYLNVAAGLIHRYNIFHRLAILYYSREYLQRFMDINSVYCNTDSIVSITPRDDLPIGDNIGEFKIEYEKETFQYKDTGIYQWGKECHYKGIPVEANIDINHPNDWKNKLPYKIDYEQRRVIKNG